MNREDNFLTATDITAVDLDDSGYINNKGASLYTQGAYSQSVEYYHLQLLWETCRRFLTLDIAIFMGEK